MPEPESAIRRGELPTHVARRIMSDFVDKGLRAGDSLADEATLLKRYGVSRGTLREALRLLTFLGAITMKKGRQGGARLTAPDPNVVGSALGLVIQYDGATLDTVFEARLALDPAVASLAAAHRSDDDLMRLRSTWSGLRDHAHTRGADYARHAIDNSMAMARATHNSVFAAIMPSLIAMTSTVPWRYPEGIKPYFVEQVALVIDAVERSDQSTAAQLAGDMQRELLKSLRECQPEVLEKRIYWHILDDQLARGPEALPPTVS